MLPTVAPVRTVTTRTVTTVIYIHKNTIKTIVTVTVSRIKTAAIRRVDISIDDAQTHITASVLHEEKKKKGTEKKEGTDDCEKGNAEFTDARKR